MRFRFILILILSFLMTTPLNASVTQKEKIQFISNVKRVLLEELSKERAFLENQIKQIKLHECVQIIARPITEEEKSRPEQSLLLGCAYHLNLIQAHTLPPDPGCADFSKLLDGHELTPNSRYSLAVSERLKDRIEVLQEAVESVQTFINLPANKITDFDLVEVYLIVEGLIRPLKLIPILSKSLEQYIVSIKQSLVQNNPAKNKKIKYKKNNQQVSPGILDCVYSYFCCTKDDADDNENNFSEDIFKVQETSSYLFSLTNEIDSDSGLSSSSDSDSD